MNLTKTKISILLSALLSLVACSDSSPAPTPQAKRVVSYEFLEDQKKIDGFREKIYDSEMYGRGEIKPWDKRYIGHAPNTPYQGPTLGRRR